MTTKGYGKFTIVSREVMNDKSLTLQAKGLYAFLLGLPDDWRVRKTELIRHSVNEIDGTSTAFKELVQYGLIIPRECNKHRNLKNQFEYFIFATKKQAEEFSVKGFPVNEKSDNGIPDNGFSDNGNSGCIQEIDTEETFTEEIFKEEKCTDQIFNNSVSEISSDLNINALEIDMSDLTSANTETEQLPQRIELMPVDQTRTINEGIDYEYPNQSENEEPVEQVPYDYSWMEEEQISEPEPVFFEMENENTNQQEIICSEINDEAEEHNHAMQKVQNSPIQKQVEIVSIEDEAVSILAEQFPEQNKKYFIDMVERYIRQRQSSGQDPVYTPKNLAVWSFNFYNGANAFQERRIRTTIERRTYSSIENSNALFQARQFKNWFERKENCGKILPSAINDAVVQWCLVNGGSASRLIHICASEEKKVLSTEEEILKNALISVVHQNQSTKRTVQELELNEKIELPF